MGRGRTGLRGGIDQAVEGDIRTLQPAGCFGDDRDADAGADQRSVGGNRRGGRNVAVLAQVLGQDSSHEFLEIEAVGKRHAPP